MTPFVLLFSFSHFVLVEPVPVVFFFLFHEGLVLSVPLIALNVHRLIHRQHPIVVDGFDAGELSDHMLWSRAFSLLSRVEEVSLVRIRRLRGGLLIRMRDSRCPPLVYLFLSFEVFFEQLVFFSQLIDFSLVRDQLLV